jgi:hypothetical protein
MLEHKDHVKEHAEDRKTELSNIKSTCERSVIGLIETIND